MAVHTSHACACEMKLVPTSSAVFGSEMVGTMLPPGHEDLWAPPLLAGSTIAEVGDRFEGDVLGAEPKAAWAAASAAAVRAVQADGTMDRIVHLSFGDFPGSEYTLQLFADHVIHAWDLARAIGADEHLDDELVASCATWFEAVEEAYRSAGAIAERPPVPGHADAQTLLLARFGRRT